MIKKLLTLSRLSNVLSIFCACSSLVAADRKPKVLGQAPQRADQSYKKYNELTEKLTNTKKPINETLDEVTGIINKEKQFYSTRYPQCKKELDLFLEDIKTKDRATKLNIANLMIHNKVARDMGYDTTPLSEESANALRKTIPEEKKQKPAISTEPTPTTVPAEPTVISTVESKPAAPTETIIQKPDITLTLPPVQITTKPSTVTTTPAPRKKSELESAGKELVPITEQQKIISVAVPNFMTEIVQPFIAFAEKEVALGNTAQKQKIETTLALIQDIVPLLTPQEQQRDIAAITTMVTAAQTPGGTQQIVAQANRLIDFIDDRLPSGNLHNNFKKINVEFGSEQSNTSISRGGISNAIKQIPQSSLSLENSIAVIDTLQNALASDTYALINATPELNTALVIANSPELTQKATKLVIPLLDSYVELKKSFALKVNDLVSSFDTVPKRGGILGYFATPDVKAQQTIIEKLLALYIGLQKIGRETVYGIEKRFNTMGYLMDEKTIETWEKENQLVVAERPSALREELEKYIEALGNEIQTLINKMAPSSEKAQSQYKLNTSTELITKALTEERIDAHYLENIEAFKNRPVKKEAVTQKIGLPGITAETTKIRKPKPTLKPIEQVPTVEPATIEPVEVEEPEKPAEFVPLIEELTKEEQEALAPLPERTAFDILTKSPRQQTDEIKKQINALDILKNNDADIMRLQRALDSIEGIDQKEQYALADALLIKQLQIERVAQIREIIAELDQKDATQFKKAYQFVKNTRTVENIQPFPESAYLELKKQFESAATKYATQLTDSLTILINLHQNIAYDITQLKQLPDNLLETVNTLGELTDFLDEGPKATLQNIFIGLCALYDATLFVLFTPEKFAPAIKTLQEGNPAEDSLDAYKEFVTRIKEMIDGLQYQKVMDAFPLLNEDTKNRFSAGKYDLTKTNTVGLDINGTYIYAVPENTDVALDTETTIPTLTAITSNHQKQYTAILDQWYERIDKNDSIQKLIEFKNNPNKSYTPEELEKIRAAITDLQGLVQEGKLPEKFFNELRDATTLSDAFKHAQKGVDLRNNINEFKKLINDTHEKFKTNDTEEELNFKRTYNTIKKDIADYPVEDQRHALLTELDTVLAPYNAYLIDVLLSYNKNLTNLPAYSFNNKPNLSTSITEINNLFNKTTIFTNMLKELKDLMLLNTNSFEPLYKELLKGYGYILATFDALNAKLVDTAKVEPSSVWEFFNSQSASYETAQTLMQLLGLASILRSTYASKLLEPYFGKTNEMEQYNKGTLNVIDLGIEKVGTKDKYLYGRTEIVGYKGTPNLIFPTGNHAQDYPAVIEKWKAFRVDEILTKMLNTPVLGTPFENIHNNDTNFFDTKLAGLIENQDLNDLKDVHTKLLNISSDITDALINNIAQLKKDKALSPVNDNINKICGNSIALLEGLIYWIYTQTKDKKLSPKAAAQIATLIKPSIQQLSEQVKKLLPYISENFSLRDYAFKKERSSSITIDVYRYAISQKKTANINEMGPVTYNGVELFQTGKTPTADSVSQSINTLNSLIRSLTPPIKQPVTTATAPIQPSPTALLPKPVTAQSISEVPTVPSTPEVSVELEKPMISPRLAQSLAQTEDLITTKSGQITDDLELGLLATYNQEYVNIVKEIQQSQPTTPEKEGEMLKKLAEIQQKLRSLQPKKDIYTPSY